MKKVNNKNILFIGSLCTKKQAFDGERIKTTYLYNSLKKDRNVVLINLSKNKIIGVLKIFLFLIFRKNYFKQVIISKDPRGAYLIQKFFCFFKFDLSRVIYFEIGPFLYDLILEKKIDSKYFVGINQIIVETNSMKCELESLGFKNLLVYPNFKNIPERKVTQLNYPKKTLDIIYFSRMQEEKGVYDAIQAVINTNNSGAKYNLSLYGSFASKQDKKKILEICKNHDFINYKGVLNTKNIDVYDILSSFDVHIFPTHCREGFPGTLIDFFISGVPTLSSSFARFADILNEEDSYRFEIQNITDLTEKLNFIYENQEELNKKRTLTFQKRKNYSVEKFELFLKELLD